MEDYNPIKIDRKTKICLAGLALLVSSLFVASVKQNGFIGTIRDINYGYNSASLNYGGNAPQR